MPQTILLVDDELEIIDINRRYLEQAGYRVKIAHHGQEALYLYKQMPVDLIITDIMMPVMDGYDLMTEIQSIKPDQAFLFVTAKTGELDKIYGLSIGADDFICKPFSPRELVLRVNNILRRLGKFVLQNEYQLGDLILTPTSRQAYVAGQLLDLSNKEFDLLYHMIQQPRRVFSKSDLYEQVWQETFFSDSNTLNVHIHALRHALDGPRTSQTPTIKTVWGIGYKLEV